MTDPLAIYLHDHLGGANFAVELLEKWQKDPGDPQLGQFAGEILAEVDADRAELKRIIERVGPGAHSLKEAAAWLAEKASRFKLRQGGDANLGIFEGLEMLALGILGKSSLWDALAVAAVTDERLQGIDFDQLVDRAKHQYARVEARRIQAAATLFAR